MVKKYPEFIKTILKSITSEAFIVTGILFFIWLFFSFFSINSNFGLRTLTIDYATKNFIDFNEQEITANRKISAVFLAKENYLGIVLIRFNTFARINSDTLLFKIKETNNAWYYQNYYKVDQFQPGQLFTFGFPIINNSKGKNYQIEIKSIHGKKGDAVAIDPAFPVMAVKYQFPKNQIISNPIELIYFFYKKIIYSLLDLAFVISSLVYMLPLIFYHLWRFYLEKTSFNKILLFFTLTPFVFILLLLFDVYLVKINTVFIATYLIIWFFISLLPFIAYILWKFYFKSTFSDRNPFIISISLFIYLTVLLIYILSEIKPMGMVNVVLLLLWIFIIRIYRLREYFSLHFVIVLMFLGLVFLSLNNISLSEEFFVWSYTFLTIGIICILVEDKYKTDFLIGYRDLLYSMIRIIKSNKQ